MIKPSVGVLFLTESKGFSRGCRLSHLALLVATVGKNSPPDCFFRKPLAFSLLVRIPFHYKKKQNHPKGWLCSFGGEQGIFPRLPPLSPRFARCHRRQKQSTGLFSSESLWLSPSLFESLFMKRKITTTKVVILSLAESKGFEPSNRL